VNESVEAKHDSVREVQANSKPGYPETNPLRLLNSQQLHSGLQINLLAIPTEKPNPQPLVRLFEANPPDWVNEFT
jgi:hypothetical protein